jgi:diguanylate cyclase
MHCDVVLSFLVAGIIFGLCSYIFFLRRQLKKYFICPVTGVYLRRKFEECCERIVRQCNGKGVDMCVIILDIDNFKTINDNHNHLAGDMVLEKVGKMLRQFSRAEDVFARYGGDEFIVIFKGSRDNAEGFIKRVVGAITTTPCVFRGKTISFTMSAGIGAIDNHGFLGALESADKSLFYSKRNGRNAYAYPVEAGYSLHYF